MLQGLSLPPDAALLEGADSLGDWILLAAMTRPEAGELFAAAGQPDCALQGGHPWRIQLHTAVQAAPEAGNAASAEPACEQPPGAALPSTLWPRSGGDDADKADSDAAQGPRTG